MSWPVSPGSLMVVFASESITSWLSLPPPPTAPAHVALATVFQVRDGALCVLLWERAREPFSGAWALPGGTLVADETLEASILRHLATKVDVREVSHLEQLGTWSDPARHPERGSSRPRTSGSCRSGSIRAFRPTRLALRRRAPRDRVRPRRDRPRRSRSPPRQALVLEHRLRARAGDVHARRAPRRLRGGARLRGVGDEPQARARPARCDRGRRQATRARPGRRPARPSSTVSRRAGSR